MDELLRILHEISQPTVRAELPRRVALLRRALDLLPQDMDAEAWAGLQVELGLALMETPEGERVENIESALVAYQAALAVFHRDTNADEWASTRNNLATAYRQRLRDPWPLNIESAIEAYQDALSVFTPDHLPFEHAGVLNNLAVAYFERPLDDRAENLEQARRYLESALTLRRRPTTPTDWATTTLNLGNVYRERLQGDRTDNVEHAIMLYHQVLEVFTRPALPEDWALTMTNLALAYSVRGGGKHEDNFADALTAYRAALEVRTLDTMPNEHRQTQRNLGSLLFAERYWSEAAAAYEAALATTDILYLRSATPQAREVELRENYDIAVRVAYCYVQSDRYMAAVVTLEQGAARAMREMLARQTMQLSTATSDERTAFAAARERVALLEAEARASRSADSSTFLAVSQALRRALRELSASAERFLDRHPDFRRTDVSYAAISDIAHAAGCPLVFLITTIYGSIALIVPPSGDNAHPTVIRLPDFTATHRAELLHDRDSTWGYLHCAAGADEATLRRVLDDAWPTLHAAIMQPISEWLRDHGLRYATLIAFGNLSLLPLPAIAEADIYFSLAPSARILPQAQPGPTDPPSRLLAVGDPLSSEAELPFAQREVELIASRFPGGGQLVLTGADATRARVLDALPERSYVHLACHGRYVVEDPLASAVILADPDRLTLRDLLDGTADLRGTRLAVLSACQTGISDFHTAPDEAMGFPAALLQAGVVTVISTLWPVNDLATALLLDTVYHFHLSEHCQPVVALRRAQAWLQTATTAQLGLTNEYERLYRTSGQRDRSLYRALRYYGAHPNDTPFAHPYYWAGFVVTGAGAS